jgi:hypothetical protein
MNAPDLLSALLDEGTFRSWDSAVADVAAEPSCDAVRLRRYRHLGLR